MEENLCGWTLRLITVHVADPYIFWDSTCGISLPLDMQTNFNAYIIKKSQIYLLLENINVLHFE